MGQAIDKIVFQSRDFKKYQQRLEAETKLLEEWFHSHYFADDEKMIGLEVETCIVDNNAKPVLLADKIISNANHELITEELADFNLEINSIPLTTTKSTFSNLQNHLQQTWQICQSQAEKFNSNILTIGCLPSLTKDDLQLKSISNKPRYLALNEQIMKARNDIAIEIDIHGKQHLQQTFNDILVESAATSQQIHLQLPPDKAHRYYNAALIISSVMVAVNSNSRYLLDKELWHETRIPIFEQAVAADKLGTHNCKFISRANFGQSYAQESLLELFINNLASHPILLPYMMNDPIEELSHLRLHNGTIWRWNRPIIGIEKNKRPHLRLEHRVMAAGTSIIDIIADTALFIGLVEALADREEPVETRLPFTIAKKNFYDAAQYGLQSKIKWIDGKYHNIQTLVLQHLLPLAQQGLKKLNIDDHDIQYYINEVIQERVNRAQTGSNWQQAYLQKHNCSMQELSLAYLARQQSNLPVFEWEL